MVGDRDGDLLGARVGSRRRQIGRSHPFHGYAAAPAAILVEYGSVLFLRRGGGPSVVIVDIVVQAAIARGGFGRPKPEAALC